MVREPGSSGRTGPAQAHAARPQLMFGTTVRSLRVWVKRRELAAVPAQGQDCTKGTSKGAVLCIRTAYTMAFDHGAIPTLPTECWLGDDVRLTLRCAG